MKLHKQILDAKCSVLRDYILDLEDDLKRYQEAFRLAIKLEDACEPYTTEWAAVGGANDSLFRYPIGYLERELSQAKYEFQLTAAELLAIGNPESKYDIERIRSIPIREFIQRFTIIKGKDMAICPIHREKTPSLKIYAITNTWYCFGCNNGGSVIDFVMKFEGISLVKALKFLQDHK